MSTEQVWTSTSTNRSGVKGDKKVYHTNQDCDLLKQANASRGQPREGLQNGWRECEMCAGDMPQTGEARTVECPWCGREWKDLPGHMRGCDG